MKHTPIITLLFSLVAVPALLHAQGPLVPPTTGGGPTGPNPPLVGGNPAASMKTLHEVEPSRALSTANTPGNGSYTYIITVPGAYHLTENLTTTGKSGILITAAGVTLDLHGFEIRADSFSTSGINIGLDGDRCMIKNGSIADFQYGVNRDLDAPDEATGGSFENLSVTGQSMIGLLGGSGWTVSNCRVHGGSNSGIVVGEGAVISNCAVSNLGGSFGSNGIEARAGSTVVNCSVRNCIVLYGIRVGRGSTLENCTASKNSGDSGFGLSSGIRADDRCLIRGCTATENTHPNNNNFEAGVGINAGFSSLVVDCHTYSNKGDGILIAQGTRVTGCRSSSNGTGGAGAGVHATSASGWNQIVDNDFLFNATGIDIDGTANMIVKNRCGGNTSNFQVVADNRVGPIVIPSNSGAISGNGAGSASGMGTTDPWANFSY